MFHKLWAKASRLEMVYSPKICGRRLETGEGLIDEIESNCKQAGVGGDKEHFTGRND